MEKPILSRRASTRRRLPESKSRNHLRDWNFPGRITIFAGPNIKTGNMDYERLFSEDVHNFMRSPVREIFKKVDLNSIYSFAGGYPNACTFPLDDIREINARVLDRYGAQALQYGATQGVTELREAVAKRYGVPVAKVQITTSSQQGIDVCTRILANPGDVVLTSSPTYLGAIQSFKSYRCDIRAMKSWVEAGCGNDTGCGNNNWHEDEAGHGNNTRHEVEAGCGVDAATLARAKFCYVIPDFQNPSGETMNLEEREALIELSRKYGFLIVEDSPYRELRYSGEEQPTIYSLAPERTLHLGSFSKVFAPGFRLGWIIGDEALLDKIYVCKQSLDLCPPVLDQYIAAEFLSSGALDRNLKKSIAYYRDKRDHMLALLERYMPEGVSWTRPEGGLFLFLTLPEHIDSVKLYDRALSAGVAYVAGSFFYPDGSHRNTMRLNFSFLDKDRMEDGIRILAGLLA